MRKGRQEIIEMAATAIREQGQAVMSPGRIVDGKVLMCAGLAVAHAAGGDGTPNFPERMIALGEESKPKLFGILEERGFSEMVQGVSVFKRNDNICTKNDNVVSKGKGVIEVVELLRTYVPC